VQGARRRSELKPVRVGCSGWNYKHFREVVYPKGMPPSRWLEHYATIFDTVEVNSTFYRLPTRRAVANWVEETPAGFVFAIKMSRYVTHVRRLRDLPAQLGCSRCDDARTALEVERRRGERLRVR
jgi:uncharacterized protein YecE (DUF72 family)